MRARESPQEYGSGFARQGRRGRTGQARREVVMFGLTQPE